MTLPASGAIRMDQVATELGLSTTGISLNHGWVRALANLPTGPISFASLYGKTGNFNGTPASAGGGYVTFNSPPWFGGTIQELDAFSASQGNEFFLDFASAPNWSGNIKVTNQTTGVSAVFSKNSSTQWIATPWQLNLVRQNTTDVFLIQPSV